MNISLTHSLVLKQCMVAELVSIPYQLLFNANRQENLLFQFKPRKKKIGIRYIETINEILSENGITHFLSIVKGDLSEVEGRLFTSQIGAVTCNIWKALPYIEEVIILPDKKSVITADCVQRTVG